MSILHNLSCKVIINIRDNMGLDTVISLILSVK